MEDRPSPVSTGAVFFTISAIQPLLGLGQRDEAATLRSLFASRGRAAVNRKGCLAAPIRGWVIRVELP